MAEWLYRLGRIAARRAWVVITAWIAILAIAAVAFAVGFAGLTSSFDVPGTKSGAVIEELKEGLPEFSGAAGTVVFQTKNGSALTAGQQQQISRFVADARDLADVADVVDPFEAEQQREERQQQLIAGRTQIDGAQTQLAVGQSQLDAAAPYLGAAQVAEQQKQLDDSRVELEEQSARLESGSELLAFSNGIRVVSQDGSTALVNVAFTEPRLELSTKTKNAVVEHFESTPIDGVGVSVSSDIAQDVPQLIGAGEIVGVVFAAIVLLVMLGSVIAAALPLVTALLGVAVAALGTLSFSGFVEMASVTPMLGVMLGLAVGIDYSLFIINRHRKQVLQGAEVGESIGLANGTAGNAVVFAGATVVVALLALNVTGVPFLGLMGTVGAIGVAIAVLIAITLTPALLGVLGDRVLGRRARARIEPKRHENAKTRPLSTWRAVATVVVSVVALLIVAIPALSMRVGLPDGSSQPAHSTSHEAFETTAHAFGAGVNGPLLVTATLPAGLDQDAVLDAQLDVARAVADVEAVVALAPIAVSDDKRLAAFQVVPKGGPNSVSTEQLVRDLRELPPVDGQYELGVAGQAAINIDISANLANVLPIYLVVVVGLSLLIMILVFRSLLVPLIATGGFILSLFATYGATVAVFQWGWFAEPLGLQTGPILSFLPIILIGILFGLAMDYQLFLASGMREAYVHGTPARLAVAHGLRTGRSVVTAAGLIMVSVFGGFIFSESTMIRSIGFGLAFGVLIDAFVVRMLLMPAVMHLLGKSVWWIPRWLDRLLPNVDVEGAALERRHDDGQPGAIGPR